MVYFVSGIGDYWLSDDQKVMLFNEGFKWCKETFGIKITSSCKNFSNLKMKLLGGNLNANLLCNSFPAVFQRH